MLAPVAVHRSINFKQITGRFALVTILLLFLPFPTVTGMGTRKPTPTEIAQQEQITKLEQEKRALEEQRTHNAAGHKIVVILCVSVAIILAVVVYFVGISHGIWTPRPQNEMRDSNE